MLHEMRFGQIVDSVKCVVLDWFVHVTKRHTLHFIYSSFLLLYEWFSVIFLTIVCRMVPFSCSFGFVVVSVIWAFYALGFGCYLQLCVYTDFMLGG